MTFRSSAAHLRRGAVATAIGAAGLLAGGLTGGVAPAGAEPPEERRFIVTLQDSVADPAAVAAEHAARHGGDVHFVYEHALKGYAATFRGSGVSQPATPTPPRRS